MRNGQRGGALAEGDSGTKRHSANIAEAAPINQDRPKGWRDILPIHPAADIFPLISKDELRELAENIKKNGLQVPIILWAENPKDADDLKVSLLDGRNRLDAMEVLGIPVVKRGKLNIKGILDFSANPRFIETRSGDDPYNLVLSLNIHRRHLTAEQRRDLIAKVLKAKPETSNRQIASQVKTDDKTVAKVRTELESRAEIPHVDKRFDSKGRKQPAKKEPSSKATGSLNCGLSPGVADHPSAYDP